MNSSFLVVRPPVCDLRCAHRSGPAGSAAGFIVLDHFSLQKTGKHGKNGNDVSARDFPPCDCLIWSCVAVEVKNVRFLPAGRWEKKCVVECQIDAPFHTRVYPNPALHVAQCGRNRRKFLQSRFFGYLALAGIFLRNIISSTLRVVSQERVSFISRALSPETGWEEWTATTL